MRLALTDLRGTLRQSSGWAAYLAFLVGLDTHPPDWFPAWMWVVSRLFYLGLAVYFAVQWRRLRKPLHIDATMATVCNEQEGGRDG